METTCLVESPRSTIEEEGNVSNEEADGTPTPRSFAADFMSTVIDVKPSAESKANVKQGVMFSRSTDSLPIHTKTSTAKKQLKQVFSYSKVAIISLLCLLRFIVVRGIGLWCDGTLDSGYNSLCSLVLLLLHLRYQELKLVPTEIIITYSQANFAKVSLPTQYGSKMKYLNIFATMHHVFFRIFLVF